MACETHTFKKVCKTPGAGHCLWCDICTVCGIRPIDAVEVKK